jgi:hypothetical protein
MGRALTPEKIEFERIGEKHLDDAFERAANTARRRALDAVLIATARQAIARSLVLLNESAKTLNSLAVGADPRQ